MRMENPLKHFFRWRWAPFVALVSGAILCVGVLAVAIPSSPDMDTEPKKVDSHATSSEKDEAVGDSAEVQHPDARRAGTSFRPQAKRSTVDAPAPQHRRGFTPPTYVRPDLKPEVQRSIRRGMEVAKAFEEGVPEEYIEDMYYRRKKRTLPIDRPVDEERTPK